VNSPLAFFALVVLVVEGGIGTYAITKGNQHLLELVAYGLAALILMVAGIAMVNPLSLYHPRYWGKRSPATVSGYAIIGLSAAVIGLGYLTYRSNREAQNLGQEISSLRENKAKLESQNLELNKQQNASKLHLITAIHAAYLTMIDSIMNNVGISMYFQNYSQQPDRKVISDNLEENVANLVEEIASMKKTLSEVDFKKYQFQTCQKQPLTADVAFGPCHETMQ